MFPSGVSSRLLTVSVQRIHDWMVSQLGYWILQFQSSLSQLLSSLISLSLPPLLPCSESKPSSGQCIKFHCQHQNSMLTFHPFLSHQFWLELWSGLLFGFLSIQPSCHHQQLSLSLINLPTDPHAAVIIYFSHTVTSMLQTHMLFSGLQ